MTPRGSWPGRRRSRTRWREPRTNGEALAQRWAEEDARLAAAKEHALEHVRPGLSVFEFHDALRVAFNIRAADASLILDELVESGAITVDQFTITGPGEPPPTFEDALAEQIGGDAYECTRVWEAWRYKTMSREDFFPMIERVPEIVEALRQRGWEFTYKGIRIPARD